MQEGGGRKGLPKSFLNRFTRVQVELLQPQDLLFIAGRLLLLLLVQSSALEVQNPFSAVLSTKHTPLQACPRIWRTWRCAASRISTNRSHDCSSLQARRHDSFCAANHAMCSIQSASRGWAGSTSAYMCQEHAHLDGSINSVMPFMRCSAGNFCCGLRRISAPNFAAFIAGPDGPIHDLHASWGECRSLFCFCWRAL